MTITAKKSLGQNFLKSEKALREIVNAGEIIEKDTILEIGPGEGALTEKILATGAKVIAIEKDDRLIEILQNKFSNEIKEGRFKLIHGDILEIDFESEKILPQKYKLIANIPYYITGQIFRLFLAGKYQPEKMVVLVQKEVAERIMARDKKESLLSISVKCFGEPKIIATVPSGAFVPAPNVDSAILAISNISKNLFLENKISEEKFFTIIHAGFAHKRKILSSNLKTIISLEKISKLKTNVRAEDLKHIDWINLLT